MGRPPRFSDADVLDAALGVVGDDGVQAATIAAIATRLGGPSGSIYHRFATRELLLARLWIRTAQSFQDGFVAALEDDDALGAALHVVHWSRAHLPEARLLLVHRRSELARAWPEELGDELAALDARVRDAISAFARRRYGRPSASQRRALAFALIDVPYAAIRSDLAAGRAPHPDADGLVRTAVQAVVSGA